MKRKAIFFILFTAVLVLGVSCSGNHKVDYGETFLGERAYLDVSYQVSLGPRVPGSEAHRRTVEWISESLTEIGWNIEVQELTYEGVLIRNVIAKYGAGEKWVIFGAHYDSRLEADQDPILELRGLPVPGANDGASGVAVLMELARVIPPDIDKEIWLVFFDAEDNGGIGGRDWILGSRAFAANLAGVPDSVVIVDMIGDADLNIYEERNSDIALTAEIWEQAGGLGYDAFIPFPKYNMIDDHRPFLEAGIPTVLLIDFDYPYWHTSGDTLDKISAESLEIVGDTLLHWLLKY